MTNELVKRYGFYIRPADGTHQFREQSDGHFVRYEDYERLQAELERWHAEFCGCKEGIEDHLSFARAAHEPGEGLQAKVKRWADQIEFAYGSLPTHSPPGPPTTILAEMRAALKSGAAQMPRDKLGWICSICHSWNHPGNQLCEYRDHPLHQTSR